MDYHITREQVNMRIDKYLSEVIPDSSRSYIQKLIGDNRILVNDQPVKANYKLRENDSIQVTIPEPEAVDITPEDIPLDILYEDDDVLIVNKPKGMVVHPSAGHYTGLL